MVPKILRLPAVIDKTGLSRATIYLKISKKTFPSPNVDIEQLNLPKKGDIVDWLHANPHTDIMQQVPLVMPQYI